MSKRIAAGRGMAFKSRRPSVRTVSCVAQAASRQAKTLVPLSDRIRGQRRVELVLRIGSNLYPRRLRVEEKVCPFGRDWQWCVDCGCEWVNELRTSRIPQPQTAPTEPTEVPACRTPMGPVSARMPNHRLVDPEIRFAFDRKGLVRATEADGEPANCNEHARARPPTAAPSCQCMQLRSAPSKLRSRRPSQVGASHAA